MDVSQVSSEGGNSMVAIPQNHLFNYWRQRALRDLSAVVAASPPSAPPDGAMETFVARANRRKGGERKAGPTWRHMDGPLQMGPQARAPHLLPR